MRIRQRNGVEVASPADITTGEGGHREDAGQGQLLPPADGATTAAAQPSDEPLLDPADAGPDFVKGEEPDSGDARPAEGTDPVGIDESQAPADADDGPGSIGSVPVVNEPELEPSPRCQSNDECSQAVCRQGVCQVSGLFSEECDELDGDDDCSEGLTCFSGVCLKPLGRVCSAAAECASAVCECADNGCSFQRCSALPCLAREYVAEDGETCAGQMNGVSAPGCDGLLACVAGQCVQPCTENDDCTDPETCRQGVCSALGEYGEVCDPEDSVSETDESGEVVVPADGDCSSEDGLICDSGLGVCRVGFEAECAQDRQCAADLACGHDEVCRMHNTATCVVIAQAELCASGYCGYRFLPPMTGIWLGRCATPRQLGESCDDVELDCIEGECVSGTCTLP